LKNIFSRFFCIAICLLTAPSLFAYPSKEAGSLSLVNSQATSMVMDGDKFIFVSFGSSIFRIDTATFALSSDQIPALIDRSSSGGLNLSGTVVGLAIRGRNLYATQDDGDLLTINLDNITAIPTTTHLITGSLGPLVADPETGTDDDKLYIIDKTDNAILVYKIASGSQTKIPLTNSLGAAVAPVALAFVPFPTASSSSTTDKIFVTSNTGLVFVINEGGTGIAQTITLSTTNKELPSVAVTPDGNFVMVVNATDTTVSILDTASNLEVDTDPSVSGINPIPLPKNGSLKSVVVTNVQNPSDVYAYVTGSKGVSVIDLNLATSSFGTPSVIDFNVQGSSDTDKDPLTLSSLPGLIVASSVSDGTVYTSNSNAKISVISTNPFVTISSTSLGTTALTTTGSFTVTFKSGATGSYRELAGGGITATGTQVASGTVSSADTDTTTSSVNYSASVFNEGTNRIFIFVTDSSNNVGRRAVDITVDTPPPAVEIVSASFGNQEVFVTINRLTPSDMDHYNIYVDTDATVVTTKTSVAGTLVQASSGNTQEASVSGLTNGTLYFIAVEGVDKAGNVGSRTSTFTTGTRASVTPERTAGLADSVGEKGCSLVFDSSNYSNKTLLGLFIGITLTSLFLIRLGNKKLKLFLLILFIFFGGKIYANDTTTQWWSLELKGGVWKPTDSTTKTFLGFSPVGQAEFGFLYHHSLGVEVGVGYIGAVGTAIGATSSTASRDQFSFLMIPIENNLTFRAHFKPDQFLVPYIKAGPDFVIFRQSLNGSVVKGMKTGLHGTGGLQIRLDGIEDMSDTFEKTMGINNIYLTLETRYGWINSFGGKGVDLSGLTFSGGFLFEF